MNKRFWIILGVIAVILIGFLLFRGSDEANAPSGQPSNNVLGDPDAEVTLVEYSDYQCPFCAVFNPVVKQVVDKYQDDIKFQLRHLPLPSHPNARAAARAAEAAGEQGKFWEMNELLFQNQSAWAESNKPRDLFKQYAEQLDLNIEKFETDFGSTAINGRINADIALFNATGESMSTPAFFLNGERIQFSSPDINEFSKYIDEALGRSQSQEESQQTE